MALSRHSCSQDAAPASHGPGWSPMRRILSSSPTSHHHSDPWSSSSADPPSWGNSWDPSWASLWIRRWSRTQGKQGNRLTRRPCKGGEFGILIFEGKKKNAGICRSRQKMFATWTFISIGRRVTQEWKCAFRLRGDSILLFKGKKKHIRNLWFSTIRIISGRHSLFQFFPLLDASVPERLWHRRCHSLQQGSVVTPCPAVGPSVLLYTFWSFVEHRRRSPFFQVLPCSIHLLSTSNNGSIGFTPQTTSKMINLSKDILLVSKMIYPPDDHTIACATCASSVT